MSDRRKFLQSALALAGGAPLLATGSDGAPAAAAPAVLPPGMPTVTAPVTDGVTIVWSGGQAASGWVEYGDSPALGQTARGAVDGLRPYDTLVLAVPLRGLRPGARVYYRTVTVPMSFPNHYRMKAGEPVKSEVFSFTHCGAGPSAKVAIWNDTHQQGGTLAALQTATDAFAPDALVWNGDMVHDQFSREEDFAATLLRPGGSVVPAATRTLVYVRGNHDARGAVARELPRFMPRALDAGYQNLVRVGPLAILVLDTGEDKEGPRFYGDLGEFAHYREAQKEWLAGAIASPAFRDAPFKVLCCHIPLRWKHPQDVGSWCPDGAARWSALLAKAGVCAVFSGHTHEFWHDRPTPEQPFHQIVGGGPRTIADQWSTSPATLVTLTAAASQLAIEVTDAAAGKNLLSLKLQS